MDKWKWGVFGFVAIILATVVTVLTVCNTGVYCGFLTFKNKTNPNLYTWANYIYLKISKIHPSFILRLKSQIGGDSEIATKEKVFIQLYSKVSQ